MATYTAGLLNVGTLTASGASGSVQASVATVTNLTATNVNATNIGLTDNLTVNKQLKVGNYNYINQNASSDITTRLDSLVNAYAWDASRNPEVVNTIPAFAAFAPFGVPSNYYTKLPFSQFDGSYNNTFVPHACNVFGFADKMHSNFKGKFRSGVGSNNTMDGSNTMFAVASATKLIASMLYARMCTLGVFNSADPVLVSKYIPVLNNITFLVPYYEDFIVDPADYRDNSGNQMAYNVKDASGNPYQVPYSEPASVRPLPNAVPAIQQLDIQGKYVNVYKSTRPLYLHDCLSESVGFATGFTDYYTGISANAPGGYNENYQYGWTAAVNDTSSFPASVRNSTGWKGSPYGLVGTRNGAGLSYNPTLEINSTKNTATGWNNTIAYYRSPAYTNNHSPLNNTALEHINNFFTDFSGKAYMQYFEHGTFNYSSSETWVPAVLTEAYHEAFPDSSAYDYYDILHKELLEPVLGSTHSMTYYFDSSGKAAKGNFYRSNVPTTWTVINNPANALCDTSSYVVSATSDYSMPGFTGGSIISAATVFGAFAGNPIQVAATAAALLPPFNYQYFTNGVGTAKGKLYTSSTGLFTNLIDYSKMLNVLNKGGVYYDASNNLRRLINSGDIARISTPSIDYLTPQNLEHNAMHCTINANFSPCAFAMGMSTFGPNVQNGLMNDPGKIQVNGNNPYVFAGAPNPKISKQYFSPVSQFEGTNWSGVTGMFWGQVPSKQQYGVSSTGAFLITAPEPFAYENEVYTLIANENAIPGSNSANVVVPRATW